MASVTPLDRFRTGKSYTITQAARLAGTEPQNVRRWLRGYDHENRHMDPVFGTQRGVRVEGEPTLVSFLELSEIVVAARIRQTPSHPSLERVRHAHEFARERWNLPFPFASLNLMVLGGEIIHEFDVEYGQPRQAIAISSGGTWVLPEFVNQAIALFDFDHEDRMATRWYPAGRDVPLVVDPKVAAGRLVIKGTLVTAERVARRFHNGEQIARIARDLSIRREDVEEAIRFFPAA